MSDIGENYKEIKKELDEQGLRLAAYDEAGWYYTTKHGKFWVSDEPLSAWQAEQVVKNATY